MWHKAREVAGRYKISASKVVDILPSLFARYYNINKDEIIFTKKGDNGVLGFQLSIYLPTEINEREKRFKIKQYLPSGSDKIVILEHTATMSNKQYKGLHRYIVIVYFNNINTLPSPEYISKITSDIQNILTDE